MHELQLDEWNACVHHKGKYSLKCFLNPFVRLDRAKECVGG